MFDAIGEYFTYYYNCYFNSSHKKNSTITDEMSIIPKNTYNYNTSMLEINDSYKLIFSNNKTDDEDIPKIIEISLYKYYNNDDDLTQKTTSSSFTFVHSNKFLKINCKINIDNYMKTINIIRNYNIKNVILPEYIYSNNFKNKEYIEIFQYYPYGDLYEYYINNRLSITEIIYIYIIDIVADYHNIGGISHRDLKLENFVFSFDINNNIQVKLIDLDFSCISNTHFKFYGGTIHYCSYELINNKIFTTWMSNDIWSLTVILYILLFKYFPWRNALDKTVFNNQMIPSCNVFNYYLLHRNSTYWHKDLNNIELNSKEFTVFNKILNYGFNINHEERTDINYIKILLSEL